MAGQVLKHRRAVRAEESQHASIADSEVEQHGGDWMWVNPVGADLQELADLADSRKMRVEVAEVFPLEKAADAFRSNMEEDTRGKIVIAVDQDS